MHSEIRSVNVERTPGCLRFTGRGGTAEYDFAGGAELALVMGQALRHARHIGDGILAEPERVRRAGIGVRLRVGDGWSGAMIVMSDAIAHNLSMTVHSNPGL